MDENAALAERAQRVFIPNYQPAPIALERGEGVYVFDAEGRRYLDMVAGIAVSALGHGHPRLTEAIRAQAGRILHTSNLYLNRPAIELAERLVARSFGEAVFFCNSGAEANEAAIKLARRYAHQRGETRRRGIVSFQHSFHGRTLGALTATAQPKYHEGFGPMPEGFTYLEVGDVEALERAVTEETAAVLIEPIQGEGGVRVVPQAFLEACRRVCDARGALLLFDEIQAGIGRTGTFFAYEGAGVVPDVMALAKGLGGGLPIGALVTTRAIGACLGVGTHGTTFGGNPVACAAGNVVLDELAAPGFLERVRASGERLLAGLAAMGEGLGVFRTVRGRGLLVGAELKADLGFQAKDVVRAARERGLLVHVAGPEVVRLVPPLILEGAHVEEALGALEGALRALVGSK